MYGFSTYNSTIFKGAKRQDIVYPYHGQLNMEAKKDAGWAGSKTDRGGLWWDIVCSTDISSHVRVTSSELLQDQTLG